MNLKGNIIRLVPKIMRFRASRSGLLRPGSPITLTYSITAACQSKCKTCNIGSRFHSNPSLKEKDLRLDEIERIFQSVGYVYFFNISGGEPYLRDDLPEIIELASRYLKPKVIHIPTNAIASEKIRDSTVRCLEVLKENGLRTPFSVKPSIDGVAGRHDEIRGVKGNFKQLEKTVGYLKDIEQKYFNFHLELGTVISNFNVTHLSEIENYVHSMGVQSYRNEIAEQRAEFFNRGSRITPDAVTYERLVSIFADKIRVNLSKKRKLTKVTESLRLVYYDLAVKILKEERQVIPCYAGITNAHINYDGAVWPCCVLGYDKPMGFLREQGYDFQKIWLSHQADRVRSYIRAGNCACPLANQAYSNILCRPTYFLKAIKTFFSFL